MPEYVVGQRVRVKDDVPWHGGKRGRIKHVRHDVHCVKLDGNHASWTAFSADEIEPEEVNHD
jgi:hypothetical protein